MKRRQNGFTLVELIIVIAVIGVLAAILIPVFSNVVKKANAKSALADARNAVSQYVAESMEQRLQGISAPENIAIIVKKGGRFYLFGYDTAANSSILVSTANENGIEAANIDALIQSSSFNTQNGGTFDPDTTYTVADGYFYLVPYVGGVSQNTNVRGIVTVSGTDFLRLDREEAGQGFDLNVGNDTAVFHGCLVNGTYGTTSTAPNNNGGGDETPASYSVNFTTTGIESADLANVVYKKGGASLTNPATLTEGTGVGTLTAECPVTTSAYSYTFTGATASNGHSTIDEAGMTITFAFTKVMAQTYHVTYNANGGSGTITDNTDYLTNAVVTLPANTFTAPEHKHFTGWLINNTGELRAVGYQFNITADTEIYAQWANDTTYTVSFDANGGSGTMASIPSVYAGAYELPECSFTRTHYHFNGWLANNTGSPIFPHSNYDVSGNVTFYVNWEQDTTYTITYDGNGATGSAPVDSNSYYMNDSATLAANTFTYTHKHFTGWKVANGGSLLTAGSSYTVTGSVTMYAQWEDDATYTVTYDANGGSGTVTDSNTYYSGDTVTLKANTFTYTHKHFTGWLVNNTGDLKQAGNTFTITANATVYAQWEDDELFSVEYIQIAGVDSIPSPAKTYYPVGTDSVPINYSGVVINELYERSDWAVGGSPAGIAPTVHQYLENLNTSSVTAGTEITLTPYVVKKGVTVSFISSPSGATGLPGTTSYDYADGLNYTINATPTLGGYDFTGYTLTSSTGVNVALSGEQGRTLTIAKSGSTWASGTATITANFTASAPVTHTITFTDGDNTDTATATNGVSTSLATLNPLSAPSGKELDKFVIGGTDYAKDASYTFTANTTVTVVWKNASGGANSFTLNLKYWNRKGSSVQQTITWEIDLAVGSTINFDITDLKQAGVYRTYDSGGLSQINFISVTKSATVDTSTGTISSGSAVYTFSYTRVAADGSSHDIDIYCVGCDYPAVTDPAVYSGTHHGSVIPDLPTVDTYVSASIITHAILPVPYEDR